jgi:hypothetical protein
MKFEFEFDKAQWNAFVKRIEKKLTPMEIRKVMGASAFWGLRHIVEAMSQRTGALKRSWKVIEPSLGGQDYRIASDSKVSLFIEEGTKAHGPKTAKFLYIPLRPGAAVWRKGFVWGKDYILVKRVKGIAAQKYLRPMSEDILKTMANNFAQQMGEI